MGIRDRINDLRVMKALFASAEARARVDGRSSAAAEDLLVAAVEAEEGSGRRALAAVGVTPEALSEAVNLVHQDALPSGLSAAGVDDESLPGTGAPAGPFPSTGSFQELFKEVQQRVRKSGSRLDGAWFVLVAAERQRGTIARALDRLDVDRAALAAAALDELTPS